MSSGASSYRRSRLAAGWVDFDRLALPVLVLSMGASALLLFHLTRNASFWADDWNWITSRRSNTVDAFLAPYNGHLSIVPLAIYRLLFAVFGIGTYTPYRMLVILLSLAVAALVFVYARARIGCGLALLAAAPMLFLGQGWQNTMWPFQIPWLIVCVAGIAALMLIEHRSLLADVGACALTLLAIAATSLGIAFTVGIAIDLALARRRWRDVWIYGIPLVLYIAWALHFHSSQIDPREISTIPVNLAQSAATGLSALTGVSNSVPFAENVNSLTYGWPLLVIALALGLRRVRTLREYARPAALAAIFLVFSASVSVARAGQSGPLASRYVYVYCLLVLLLAAELARGIRPSGAVQLALCVVVLATIVANIGTLRVYGAYFRASGATTNGALAALDLDRGGADPDQLARIGLYPFVKLPARSYFEAKRALGTPAYTTAQLRRSDPLAQAAADSQLLADGEIALARLTTQEATAESTAPTKGAPPVTDSVNGSVVRDGPCVRFTPAATLPPGSSASFSLTLGHADASVMASEAQVSLSVRRFAPGLMPLGAVAAGGSASVTIRRDSAPDPWYLQISSIAPVRVCGLT